MSATGSLAKGARRTGLSAASTQFRKLARGANEERFGPFAKYADAMEVWRGKAWATVDDGFSRYRIEEA